MRQPEGFEIKNAENKILCKLKKAVYGFKLSSKAWKKRIDEVCWKLTIVNLNMSLVFILKNKMIF